MRRRRIPFPSHIDDWGGVRRAGREARQAEIDRMWDEIAARIPVPKVPEPTLAPTPAIEVTEPQTEDERTHWLSRSAPEERN